MNEGISIDVSVDPSRHFYENFLVLVFFKEIRGHDGIIW